MKATIQILRWVSTFLFLLAALSLLVGMISEYYIYFDSVTMELRYSKWWIMVWL